MGTDSTIGAAEEDSPRKEHESFLKVRKPNEANQKTLEDKKLQQENVFARLDTLECYLEQALARAGPSSPANPDGTCENADGAQPAEGTSAVLPALPPPGGRLGIIAHADRREVADLREMISQLCERVAQLEVKAQEKPRSPKKGRNKDKKVLGKLMNALKSVKDVGSPKMQDRKSSGGLSKKSSSAERIGRAGSIAFHIPADENAAGDSESDEEEKTQGNKEKKKSGFFKG